MKYICLHLQDDDPAIIKRIQQTVNCTVKGDVVWVPVRSDKDIMETSFELAFLNTEISDDFRILNPYMWEFVEEEDD